MLDISQMPGKYAYFIDNSSKTIRTELCDWWAIALKVDKNATFSESPLRFSLAPGATTISPSSLQDQYMKKPPSSSLENN